MKILFTIIMVITWIIILITTVFGVLPIDELCQTLYESVNIKNSNVGNNSDRKINTDSSNIFVNPNGPLNLLHGYFCREKKQLYTKRLFSPGFNINYSLTRNGENSTFFRDNTGDTVNELEMDNKDASQYLTKYYEAVKMMYNVVNNEANIYTNGDTSLHRFLTQKLSKEDSFKLLAIMLLLAEGIELPLMFKNVKIKYKRQKNSQKTVQALLFKNDGNSPIRIEMYSTIKREGEDKNGVRRVNEHFYKLKEVVNLVQFFIDYGGINKKNVDEYNIKEDDKPSFLIRSYIFEFINNLKDAKEFFRIVNDLIIYTNKGKDGNIWKMFFTEKGEEVRKYKPIFEALRKVDLIISSIKFPFSTYNQPPSNVTVKGYDRGMGKETTDLYFSDCCDITIYTLFCCLLYDPSIEGYSLDQMNKNNYNPSLDLKKFFTDRNNLLDSASGTPPNIHQEWTHVVQNLTLREDELMGGVVSGSNTIIYLKKMGEAAVELETDILNVLKVVAKVSGVPSKRMMELGRITAIAQSDKADISVIKTCIKEYAAKVFGEISAMKIEIDIIDIYSVNIGKCKGIYGKLDIKFRNRDSNNRLFELEHVVRFDFTPMHAGAKVISKNNEIKKEDKENLEGLIKECDKMVLELGKKAANKVRAFLNHRNFELILPKLIEEIELAENKINRYIAINNVLNDCRLTTINEKLYFIDLFSPYLDKVTKDGIENNSNTVLDSTSATFQNLKEFPVKKAKMLDPNDPLLQLISNVLGSVPLNDEATQYFFVQILSSCNGKHRSLFPRIQGAVKIVLPFPVAVAALSNTFEKTLFLDLHDYNVPNMLSRLYKKLRVRHGDSFYKVIAERSPLFNISYIPMVKRCVELNNSAGIEAAKKDFKIRKGKIDLNLDEIGRFRWWLEIAIETQYLKGLEEICNTWEYISKKENTKFRLEVYSAITGSYETNWDKLSSELLKKISVNERYTKALLEMCIYGVDNYTEMNRIYKALAPYLSIQSLASFFENINRELREQLEKMVIIRDSKLSYFSLWEVYSTVEFCIEWIVRMEYWVKKTAEYVHTRDDYDPQSGIIKSLMAIDDGITAMITDGHELKVSIAKEIEC